MMWPLHHPVDDDTVRQLRKLAQKCSNLQLAKHNFSLAKSERLRVNRHRDINHQLRVKYIIARDVRFVRKALTDPSSVVVPVRGSDDELSEDEGDDEGENDAGDTTVSEASTMQLASANYAKCIEFDTGSGH